jgi:subtilase family serine protease
MYLTSVVLAWVLIAAGVSSGAEQTDLSSFKIMGKRIPRSTFRRIERSNRNTPHEVMIAVKQRNLQELEAMVLERSKPGSEEYRNWLKHEEVGLMVSNAEATAAVEEWLATNSIQVTWKSVYGEYLKATAPIEVWERLLKTEFFRFEDISSRRPAAVNVHRADEYSIPAHLEEHVFTIFNTVQTPPELNRPQVLTADQLQDRMAKRALRGTGSVTTHSSKQLLAEGVNIAFLNEHYQIPSNTGSREFSQSVFQTNDERFSPSDLAAFQDLNGLPDQDAEDPFDRATSNCGDDCFEGNLDLQVMMGIAQETTTIFWHTEGSDPFVDYLTQLTGSDNPPLVNSVSWGSIEQVLYC